MTFTYSPLGKTYHKLFVRFGLVVSTFLFLYGSVYSQSFPNPATLSTGQGAAGTIDPIWQTSTSWFGSLPLPNPMTLTYAPALINNNCAPGSWVNPAALPPPVNNGNWITANGPCATSSTVSYIFYRLTLNLPADCNGVSVTTPGTYTLSFDGYVDNSIREVYINGTPQGISGGGFSTGTQLTFTLNGPWLVGTNYVDVAVYNAPPGGTGNPYGLLLVANASAPTDTDGDGVPNIDDLCPCDPGTNPYGCDDPTLYNCDIDAIRTAFTNAGCIEMAGCSDECSIYFINPQQMTGSQAQAFAQTLGANLVSIQSQAENDCILSSLTALGQSGVIWIGFSDEISEGNFVWYDQAPITYTNWAPGEPNQSGNEDCVQIYPTGANPGTWNDLSCTSANSRSIIEVNLCPVINAGLDVSVCLGNTANLQASNTLFGSSPYTYAWSNGVNVQPNPVAPTTQTSYVITTTDRYSCTTKDTVVVSVNPLPVVSAGPDVVVCPQQTVTLSGAGAANYGWTSPVVNGIPFYPPTSSQNYMVTGTDVNGCIARDTVNVSIQLDGCPNFPNTYLCDIDSIRSAFSNAGCIEMATCVSECSIYFLNPQSMTGSQAQSFAQTLGSNLVSIQSSAENSCILSSLVSLGYGTGDVVWIGFSDEVNEGDFVWYDQSPITYTNWAPGEPNQSGDEDCVQIYPGGANPGTWNDLPCGSLNSKSIIEVNLCPVVNLGPDITICYGQDTSLTSSNALFGSSPYIYTWSTNDQGQSLTVAPTTRTNYSINVIDRYSCKAADTVTVNVNPKPLAMFVGSTVCEDSLTQFTDQSTVALGGTITQWNWNFDDGSTSTLQNPDNIYPSDGDYDVTLVVTTADGCKDTLVKNIIVKPNPPQPVITDNSPVECPGDELVLEINVVQDAGYFWTGPNNFTSDKPSISLPLTDDNSGTYSVFIKVDGCSSTVASTIVSVIGSLTPSKDEFPNIITPNGDGVNDVLDIDQYFSNCLDYKITIWNRWGNPVYEQSFGQKPFEGKSMSGAKLTPGVYYYIISYGSVEKRGTLTIAY
jgi:gliding motility-associated-like protein